MRNYERRVLANVIFWMSLHTFFAEIYASFYDYEPITISFPDLNNIIVHFGLVFRIISAGKRFLL
jgi:hypothetical protein